MYCDAKTLTHVVKTLTYNAKTLTYKVKMLTYKVKTLTYKVKTLTYIVKTLTYKVKTLTCKVKTLTYKVKMLRRRNALNMTVFEVFSKRYILTDHIFIIKKNMSNVSCESIILAIYEVNVNVENWEITNY